MRIDILFHLKCPFNLKILKKYEVIINKISNVHMGHTGVVYDATPVCDKCNYVCIYVSDLRKM